VERVKGGSLPHGQHMGSVAYAEEMMSTLRRSHASLWSSLEAILEELIVKFRPSYEEELLATISALLERGESHSEKQSLPNQKRTEEEEALVSSWTKTLSRIAAKFFKASEPSTSSNRRDERAKKTREFKLKYKNDFEEDFKLASSDRDSTPSSSDPKPELQRYMHKLQLWKEKLETQVSRTPTSIPMMESSRSLAMYYGDVPDLWPGSCDTKYSVMDDRNPSEDDSNLRSQSTTPSSAIIAKKAALKAALLAANAAAKEGIGGEYGGGSATIEIPGQYCPNSFSSSDVRPCPELHAHLVKFEPFVQVLRRNDQLVRRCGMVGSDGKTYRFLLQFAIPHWTRSDERTAQTSYVVDKFIRQNLVSARHYLSIQPNAAIPVAQRLRMTPDCETRLALDEVYRAVSSRITKPSDSVTTYFLNEITKRTQEKGSLSSSDEEKTIAEKDVRLEVYREVCNMIQNKIFVQYLQEVLGSPESFFLFRRVLSVQLAANSLLQYVFSVAERTPQRVVMLLANARVMSPDFRVTYSNQGFIEESQVPFRMTPNIEAAIGEHYIQGKFVRSIAMIAGAIKEHKEEFDPILRLLMRDDILSWYTKSQAKTDSKTQELERQLIERVSKNVYTLQSRIAECSPSSKTTTSSVKNSAPLDKRVNDLLKNATDPQNLCMMAASYQAWL
jgi:transformation/transcription domain-associated protein